ncbi:hypothetical protein L1765_12325 [Microaerobacter geothermalis]|uniref:hypothetical protein n=1 Tax=Microaerobacter geothermalis TaxID=674972 RepID=UPI001F276520|nr:hypothetical protein [Microaerobacter geothermalis]MCF6094747.1 hypothetical protein [Microaerobacter geothermalis]
MGLINSTTDVLANKIATDLIGFNVGCKTAKKLGADNKTAVKVGGGSAFVVDIANTNYKFTEKITSKIRNYIGNEFNRIKKKGRVVSSYIHR